MRRKWERGLRARAGRLWGSSGVSAAVAQRASIDQIMARMLLWSGL